MIGDQLRTAAQHGADVLGTNTGSVLPSQERMERSGAKVVRLREAGCRYEAQLLQLERQYDAKARELSEEFLSVVDKLNSEE